MFPHILAIEITNIITILLVLEKVFKKKSNVPFYKTEPYFFIIIINKYNTSTCHGPVFI